MILGYVAKVACRASIDAKLKVPTVRQAELGLCEPLNLTIVFITRN